MEWTTLQSFRVYGSPKGQPRPRAFARRMGEKFVARVYDAGTAEAWKGDIALAAKSHRPATPLVGPVRVDIDLFFERPKRLCRRHDPVDSIPHTAKPDRDNCDKAILDAMTRLGFWEDDAQVCAGEVSKWYVPKGEPAGAWIKISVPSTEEETL